MSRNSDTLSEFNPGVIPPLTDTGLMEFEEFLDKTQGGEISAEQMISRFQYYAPRLLARIKQDKTPSIVEMPPPGSQGAREMGSLQEAELRMPDHPLVGRDVMLRILGVEEPINSSVISVEGGLVEVIEKGGMHTFVPVSNIALIECVHIASANPDDYSDLAGLGIVRGIYPTEKDIKL